METFNDLLEKVRATGKPIAVEFIKNSVNKGGSVEDLEGYTEVGMRAEVTGGKITNADVLVLDVDYSKFEDFNKAFETSNYFDVSGHAILTAREAGQYKAQDTLYLEINDPVQSIIRVLEAPAVDLYAQWRASPDSERVSYVGFLEAKVLALAPEAKPADPITAPRRRLVF